MKQKKTETVLFSAIGVAVMFVIVVAVNIIGSAFNRRLDMTEQKLYTLTDGTKAILKKLDGPVEIRFYYSKNETRLPPQFQTLAQSVDDLLTELRQASGGKITIKKFDPQPNSEAEDSAGLDGIEGQPISAGERFYLGLCVSMDPLKASIPFIAPQRERLIEYDIVRAISQVLTTNRPVVGVMTALPIFGSQMPPQMMMQMRQQPQEAWAFISELKRDFDVRQIAPAAETIEAEIKVLFVLHPKNLTDATLYAIDQFLMRGGRLIACLDPHALTDQQPPQNPMMPAMPGGPSNLEKLLKAWGLTFETTKVIGDMDYAKRISLQQGQPPALHTAFLFLNDQAVTKDDVAMSQIDDLWFPFAGVFTGTPASGLKQTDLIKSSKNSQLVDGFMALQAPQKVADEFKAGDKQYAIALRLEGKFKTAFPEGKPEAKPADDKEGEKKEEKKPEDKAKDTLKESKSDTAVILIGDVDWLSDFATVNILGNFGGQRLMQPKNGNLTLVQNVVEQMAGDQNLIGVRSRASLNRPFTVVQKMEAKAEEKSREELGKLQKEADEANQKITELQGKKEPGQRFIRSKEQQEEFERFNQKRATANKRLKEIDRERRRDVESLQFWTKVANIGAVPFIVAIVGIALGISRKQRTKAQ